MAVQLIFWHAALLCKTGLCVFKRVGNEFLYALGARRQASY